MVGGMIVVCGVLCCIVCNLYLDIDLARKSVFVHFSCIDQKNLISCFICALDMAWFVQKLLEVI